MYKPKQLQSGDLVRFPNQPHSNSIYGIVFFLDDKPFLLVPDGNIRGDIPIELMEWTCHTALVHGPYFRSLEQVREDFFSGKFDHVIGSVPLAAYVAKTA